MKEIIITGMNYLAYFVTIWVAVFFMTLPLFNPAPPKKIGKGHATSAPDKHYMGRKIIISLSVSFIILLTIIILQWLRVLPTIEILDSQ